MFHQSEKFHEYETSSNQIAVQNNIRKYQGYLLKKKKVVGFKPYFVVLYRGNLIYYKNDSDAKQDLNRKRTLSLENAIITIDVKINKTLNKFQHSYACCAFAVRFRTGKTHMLYSFPLEAKDTKRRSITHLQKILYQNSLDIARERKTKWSCALQQHIEYASKAQEIERLGLKINVQIENVEKHLMIFREKLANIYTKPDDDDNQSSSSSDDDDDDFDSQIGSSVNESFDTAEEFTDDDSDDTMMDDDEKDSGRQSGLSVQVVNNQNKVFSQGGFGIDLQSWRTRLPCKMVDRSQISIWSIAKQFIGKELARLSIPAVLCEPLSFLQRVGESVQYARLLTRAVQCADDPCKRIELVSAFLFSVLGCVERMAVPFTPVLGETYELVRHDLGFRIIIEHVSAHPPMSAYRCESIDTQFKWSISGHLSAKFKFWGRSVEIETKGFNQLEFPTLNEIYTWRPVSYCIHAVILGPSWLEHYNNVEISCNNGFKSVLNFKPTSSYNKENHRYDGYIYDNKMNKVKAVYGVWMKSFYSCEVTSYDHYLRANKKLPTPTHEMGKSATEQQINEIGQDTQQPIVHYAQSTGNIQQRNSDVVVMRTHRSRSDDPTTPSAYFNLDDVGMEKEKQSSLLTLEQALQTHQPPVKDFAELWVAFDQPSYETDYYWFSYLAMSLNELNEELERTLPQTDSRYRPDIRCLETGDIDGASREKQSVEDRQREAVKSRNKEEYRPQWFQLDLHPQLNEDVWVFNHKYWNRNFANCPNLFLKK